ncbi:MAG: HAMP domain-containing histidine kinase [Bacteroidetes bacterium]|nr:HAMP domain-containing histidine kinase [Bacteroidota bacterium]
MDIQLGRLIVSGDTLQRILDFLPYPFAVARLKKGVWTNAYVNKRFVDEIGYSIKEVPTINKWFELAYPDIEYRKQVEAEWSSKTEEANASGQNSISVQALIRTKHFNNRWYEVKASLDDPQMIAFIDIHASKSQEENLKMLNQNRDRVLSVLGHDLRGPMGQLYSLSRMASKQQVTQEEFMKLIANVNDKATQSMEFLATTLTWAKSNFDAIRVKREEIELRPVAEEVIQIYEANCSDKNIRMILSVDPTFTVKADREIIVTVLRNLLSNAIKFTNEQGSIEVAAARNNSVKSIIVRDTGIGMDASTAKRILSSNYSSSVGTAGEKGLGIGIMLCNDLLKRMGATLRIESELGKGTLMEIVLP